VSAAFTLISLTGFNAVCAALLKFRVPRPFVVQLLFSHRYIFVLTDEAYSMLRARSLRAPASRLLALKTFIPLTGNLLLRSLGRAERIYRAMCCRGFDGQIRLVRPMRLAAGDVIFTCGWILVFAAFRYFNAPLYLGSILTGLLR
jgi:cobalt/nickel transport system permease protein